MNIRTLCTLALVPAAAVGGAGAGRAGTGAASASPAVLAYASDPGGNLDVYVVGIGDGASPRQLTSSPRDEFSPSWSPDGRRIAFRVNPPRGDEGDIWTMRGDGTHKRNLTRSPRVADWSPAWSPDGRYIAYFSMAAHGADIWVMSADGSHKKRITQDGALNEYPTWSPDGRHMAFNSHRDGQFEIYRSNSSGKRQRNLTRHAGKDQWPAWSRDETSIAFVSERDGSEDVFVMRADGSSVRNLTRTTTLEESHPAWMPDGRISFARHGETGPIELWSANADGSEARRLGTAAEPIFVFSWRPVR
jgi:Tol biopolymer transport system component